MARFTSLVLALATAFSPIAAHPANGPRALDFGCGTTPSAAFMESAKQMSIAEAKTASLKTDGEITTQATITINTYFHVVAKSTAVTGGYLTTAMVANQIAVMNSNYGMLALLTNIIQSDC